MKRSTRWGVVDVAALGMTLVASEAMAQGADREEEEEDGCTTYRTIRSTQQLGPTTRRSASGRAPSAPR